MLGILSLIAIAAAIFSPLNAQAIAPGDPTTIIVVHEPGFPSAETAKLTMEDVEKVMANAGTYTVRELSFSDMQSDMPDPGSSLVIWPYGSAMSDAGWSALLPYIQAGGNLLVPGGRAFSMDVLKAEANYQMKGLTNRFLEELNIVDTEPVDMTGMTGVAVGEDFDFLQPLPNPAPSAAYSMLAMMASRELYNRNGSLSTIDGEWKSILSGVDEEGLRTVPLVSQFDRHTERYVGGRWVFCTFTPAEGYWQSREGTAMLRTLVGHAAKKPLALRVKPDFPYYQAGEKPAMKIDIATFDAQPKTYKAEAVVTLNGKAVQNEKFEFVSGTKEHSFSLKKPVKDGLYSIQLTVSNGNAITEKRAGSFLVGDLAALNTGESFGTNSHFLTRGGNTFPVVGMTYMSSDVHRYFFIHPNPAVWDRDMAYMKASGINMLRTGIWTGHEHIVDYEGNINEYSMRAFDAFFMLAKKHDLPVQFNFFHMQPSFPGSDAPYSDPEALTWQNKYVTTFVKRYKDNPDIIWDLINEPSYGKEGATWTSNTPTGHSSEYAWWNEWLKQQYGDNPELIASKWNMTVDEILDEDGQILFPDKWDMTQNKFYAAGVKPLAAYDYNLFANHAYNRWAGGLGQAIRSAGSDQLVVTGQDEGGVRERVLSQFYAEESAITTIHNWWSHDDLLWDNITGKVQGKPFMVQETGNMRYTDLREYSRLSEQALANSLERKMSFGIGAEGAGAIPWIWNLNIYLYNENEIFIGMHRGDGTAKEEVKVVRGLADFVQRAEGYFSAANDPEIAIMMPLSLQLTAYSAHAQRASERAVRALHYYAQHQAIGISEYHLERAEERPKLIILPSAMVLHHDAWEKLMNWVWDGSTLLVTGPIDRDPHFQPADRLAKFGLQADAQPIIQHVSQIEIDGQRHPLHYYGTLPMPSYDKMVWETDHGKVKSIAHGQGKILSTEYPVEWNTSLETTAALYQMAAGVAGVERSFTTSVTDPGVLIRPMDYEKGRLYLIVSESDTQRTVDIQDKITGKTYSLKLSPGRAHMFMIDKADGRVVSQYAEGDVTVK